MCVSPRWAAQSQVVTLALDALLERGETFGELIVIHLSERNPRYREALALLAQEFAGEYYRGRPCRYRPQAVTLGGQPIDDLDNEPAIGAALNTFSRLIRRIKQQDCAIHLCLSGGRRLLGMLAMSAIQLYGDHADQVWHLFSSDEVRERTAGGALLHLPQREYTRLVRVPVPGMRPVRRLGAPRRRRRDASNTGARRGRAGALPGGQRQTHATPARCAAGAGRGPQPPGGR